FSQDMPPLVWTTLPKKGTLVRWEPKTARSGVLIWPEPLERSVELESFATWELDKPLALPNLVHGGGGWLETPLSLRPTEEGLSEGPVTTSVRSWRYTSATPSPRLRSAAPGRADLAQIQLASTLLGRFFLHEFIATVPAQDRPVTLQLPTDAEPLEAQIQ